MSLFIRKSVRVGPFRFNLSKSGIGVSTGIPGLRIGTGPRGNYIHMGRGGLYYRKTLPTSHTKPQHNIESNNDNTETFQIPQDSHEPLQEIDSGAISEMVDSSSQDLVNELNSKRKTIRVWPLTATAGIISVIVITHYNLPTWSLYTAITISIILTLIAVYRDTLSKSVVMLYDIEDKFQDTYESLHNAFNSMMNCKARWHLKSEGKVKDKKYHAGADNLVTRSAISLSLKNPPYVKTNVTTPSIPVGSQTLYFFPDMILVFESAGIGAVSYENLAITISSSRFIEEESVPRDTEIVDHTWKYVNKRGGPDKRFKDNKQIPIVLYEDVRFTSNTGLNERVQLSKTGITQDFVDAIKKVGSTNRTYDM